MFSPTTQNSHLDCVEQSTKLLSNKHSKNEHLTGRVLPFHFPSGKEACSDPHNSPFSNFTLLCNFSHPLQIHSLLHIITENFLALRSKSAATAGPGLLTGNWWLCPISLNLSQLCLCSFMFSSLSVEALKSVSALQSVFALHGVSRKEALRCSSFALLTNSLIVTSRISL